MAYAALLYLKLLLEEEAIYFLCSVLKVQEQKVRDFCVEANKAVGSFTKFKILKDVPPSYLARLHKSYKPIALAIKTDLRNIIPHRATLESEKFPDRATLASESSKYIQLTLQDLEGINSSLEEFVNELDGGGIHHPSATLSQQRELANDLLSTNQEIKEVVTLAMQAAEAAISLHRRVGTLLPKLEDFNNHEVMNPMKIAAGKAADSIEDLLTGNMFSWEKDFLKVKNTYDLLKDIDQLLADPFENIYQLPSQTTEDFSDKRFTEDDMLKDIDQLLSNSLEAASCSEKRFMEADPFENIYQLPSQTTEDFSDKRFTEDDMLKDIDRFPSLTFKEEGSSFERRGNDSTDVLLSDDLQGLANLCPTDAENEEEEDTDFVASPMSTDSVQEDIVVGIDDYICKIIDELTRPPSGLTTVTIVGMGGIGKTTLAKKVFNHPGVVRHFDRLTWVNTASSVDQVLSHLLHSVAPSDDEIRGQSREDKGEFLWKSLRGRRYLIVVDSLWDFEAWDAIKEFFPDDKVGSRILITSRFMQFPSSTGTNILKYPHCVCMHPLNKNQSWELLEKKLFGKQRCPIELMAVGKQIAEKCEGLPLTIVVIAGTLRSIPRSYSSWRSIRDGVNSIVYTNPESCLDILALSYNYLPHHLKSCFLSMGAFPANYAIEVQKLINIWIAERFVQTEPRKSQEKVAEDYLEDLIGRSLVLVEQRSFDGKIKTCLLHNLLRQLCLKEAQKINFMHVFEEDAIAQDLDKQRRLVFNLENCADLQVLPPLPHLRSFLWLTAGSDFTPGMIIVQLSGFERLRVLDMYFLPLDVFPEQLLKLVLLSYLALNVRYQRNISISQLPNLQTLVIYGPWVPREGERNQTPSFNLHKVPCLRHVNIMVPSFVACLSSTTNLQTLSTITFSSCTRDFWPSTFPLKKLGVSETKEDYEKARELSIFSERLSSWIELKVLKCSFYKEDGCANYLFSTPHPLPLGLRKLTLSGSCLSWDKMEFIAYLPELETLKLKKEAFKGREWVLNEEVFRSLKQLLMDNADLVNWEAESTHHFPSLERLVLRSCKSLEKIPCGVGESSVLELIELHNCNESAKDSARGFKEQREDLRVIIRS